MPSDASTLTSYRTDLWGAAAASNRAAADEARADAPKTFVPVHLTLLQELNAAQMTLERYVRGYWASQERLETCWRAEAWLNERKAEARQFDDPDFWRRLDELVRNIAPLKRLLGTLKFDEEFCAVHEAFDGALATATQLVRSMRRPGQEGMGVKVADDMYTSISVMSDACDDLRMTCRDQADEIIDAIKQRLDEILIRFDEQERAASAPGVQGVAADFGSLRGGDAPEEGTQGTSGADVRRDVGGAAFGSQGLEPLQTGATSEEGSNRGYG